MSAGTHALGGRSGPLCRGCSPLLTSLVLRSKRLEVPGVLQGLHLLADSAAEQADKVQAVQLEFETAVEVQKALPVRYGPPNEAQTESKRWMRQATPSLGNQPDGDAGRRRQTG